MTTKKAQLGQFMTTNSQLILQGINIPSDFNGKYIEPFAGKGDLVKYLTDKQIDYNQIECYDIDTTQFDSIQTVSIYYRDTLLNPIQFDKEMFIITNPPYLARNKSKDKEIFDLYKQNDLYKCFIQQLIDSPPFGGIIIIPLNFWCSIRKMDIELRRKFLSIFRVERLNIFESSVFDDTSYTTCSMKFLFDPSKIVEIPTWIYSNESSSYLTIELNDANAYSFGGELYALKDSNFTVSRLTKLNETTEYRTGIIVKCIDGKMDKDRIRLEYSDDLSELDKYIDRTPKLSFRSFAVLAIEPKINVDRQQRLVKEFNEFLNEKRKIYHSLFLPNYRDYYRKRISFELVYQIVSIILSH